MIFLNSLRGKTNNRRRSRRGSYPSHRTAFETLEQRCLLATLIVNSTEDAIVDDFNNVTLREAIIAANQITGFDIIRFDPEVFPMGKATPIKLSGTPLDITSELLILGPGVGLVDDPLMPGVKINSQQIIIDANNLSSVFTTSGTNTQISGVAITGGNDAGVVNTGTLLLDRVTVSGNSGVTGGGVRNSGSLTVDRSIISKNNATSGGGIYTTGSVTIYDTAIIQNTASADGGGLAAVASIAGLDGAAASIINSTISNNVASSRGAGIWSADSSVGVAHATITGNRSSGQTNGGGGGIGVTDTQFSGTVTLQNSIVAGNTRGSGTMEDIADDITEFTAAQINQAQTRSNLIGDPNSAAGIVHGTLGNIVGDGGTKPLDINSVLDTRLQNVGGISIGHPLLPGSPAIDAGDNSLIAIGRRGVSLEADQRGLPFLRKVDSPTPEINGRTPFIEFDNPIVDIGAIELQPVPMATSPFSLVVSTIVDESDGDFSPGDLSLREAIEISNRNPDRNVITIAPGLPAGTSSSPAGPDPRVVIRLDPAIGELLVTQDLAITGPGSESFAISGAFDTRVFHVGPDARVDLSGLGIKEGQVGDRGVPSAGTFGAGLYNEGIVDLHDVAFDENRVVEGDGTVLQGGAAIVNTGTMTMDHVSVTKSLALAGSTPMFGGAIYNSGTLEIGPAVVLADNSASFGGGLYNFNGTVSMRDTVIERNAAAAGGGIYNDDGTLSIETSRLLSNSAETLGAGIYGAGGNLSVRETTLDGNKTTGMAANMLVAGGGIYADTGSDGTFVVSRSTLSNNESRFGGGIYLVPQGAGEKLIAGTTVSGNAAKNFGASGGTADGAGILVASTAGTDGVQTGIGVKVTRATIVNNTNDAGRFSAGLAVYGKIALLENTILAANRGTSILALPADIDLAFSGGIIETAEYNFVSAPSVATQSSDDRFAPNPADKNKPNPKHNIISDSQVVAAELEDNGGPTLTHKLVNNSPAIDNGKGLRFEDLLFIHNAFDQRGLPVTEIIGRPPGGPPELGTSTDIGALEVQQLAVVPWESFVDSVSQFAPTNGSVEYGVGFDNGKPNSNIKAAPEFLGMDLDPRPVNIGGVESVLGAKFGAEARLDAKIKIGLEYGYYVNAGSVDVRYEGDISYAVQQSQSSPGSFEIDTGVHIEDGLLYTISPKFGFYIDLVIQFDFDVSGRICAFKCASGEVPIPDVDERITLLAINRPKQDSEDVDGDGDKFEQLLIDESLPAGMQESPRDDARFPNLIPKDRILKPQFTGDIQFLSSPMDLLLEKLPDEVGTAKEIGDYLHEEFTARAEAKAEEMVAEQDKEKGKPGADEKAAAAKKKVEMADKKIAEGTKKKPDAKAQAGGGIGFVVDFGESSGDSLLGVEVGVAIGGQVGDVGLKKPLGSLKLTLPDVQLADSEIDPATGVLSASTSDFVDGSTQDQNRQIAELSLDVAGILGPLIGFPGGRFEASFGPVTAKVTTVAYDLITSLNVTQDVDVTPYFNDPDSTDPAMQGDNVAGFHFAGPVRASVNGGPEISLDVTTTVDHDQNPATAPVPATEALRFKPGDSLKVTPVGAASVTSLSDVKGG